ncbi:hypothetical protein CHS0354_001856 [Potamilus streckersoni]|uniref:DUF7042 domain-containing protein n=1 Tax=Potamilus streckersoni TaxID=2493646 RepID=A0AAE0VQQ3_9BIVA|nr:hypothetical protein CHS0354_001856 [Potamilus streckersoni]
MLGVLPITLLSCIFQVIGGSCNFPNGFLGTWKSSNYGTFIFGSNSMYMSTDITGSSKRNYTCESNSGTKYVIRTTESFLPFVGATTYFYAYICLDLRETSAYSYYYYQQSDKDIGFNYERAKAFNTTGISLNAVCETTVDVTEYHVMVKEGFGNSVQVTCPDIFLGVFYYNYNDTTSSYCNGVSRLDVCNNNKTTLIFNYTLCSQRVGFSAGGIMGCIASVKSGSNTYLTTYNQDSTVDGSTTTTFACFAATTVGSSVVASIKQTECSINQSPTTLPAGGGILLLTANYTCLPVSTTPETKNYTWIIVGSVLGFLALVGIILFLIYCLCFWWPKRKRERRIRAKTIIENEDKHPLAESSLTLDAPSSLEHQSISEIKNRKIFDEDVPSHPMDESRSVKIDFRGKTWIKGDKPYSNGGPIMNGVNSIDPRREFAISEVDTVSRIPHRLEEEYIIRAMSPVTTVTQETAKSSLEISLTEKPNSKFEESLPPLTTSVSSVKRYFPDRSSKHDSQRKSAFAWTENSDAASFFEARSQNKKRRRRKGYSILQTSRSHTPASRSSRTRSTRSSFYDNKFDREDDEWEDEEVEELEHDGIAKSKPIVLDSGRRMNTLPPRPTIRESKIRESKPRQSRKQQRRKKSRQSNRSRSRGNMFDRIKSLRHSPYRTRMSIKRFSNGQAKQLQRSRTMSGHMSRPPKPFKKTKHDPIGIRLHRSYTEASIRKVNQELQLRPNYVNIAWR